MSDRTWLTPGLALALTLGWSIAARADEMPACSLPQDGAPAVKGKASTTPRWPAVRLQVELRDAQGSTAGRDVVVSSRPAAAAPALRLWVDNGQAVEARAPALAQATSGGGLNWVWSPQGVSASPAPVPQAPAPDERWWFCPAWPGGSAEVLVHYRLAGRLPGQAAPSRPEVAGRLSVALDQWVTLWAPPEADPPREGLTVRSAQAGGLPRLEMRWRVVKPD